MIIGPGIGFENLTLEEVVGRTVIVVGAGLQNSYHCSAVGVSVSGIGIS